MKNVNLRERSVYFIKKFFWFYDLYMNLFLLVGNIILTFEVEEWFYFIVLV